jgi:hypothetical protein
MSFATWMECTLGHMWALGEDDCPVCGRTGWAHAEKIEPDADHMQRAAVIKNVTELEAEVAQLRRVIAEQAHHHKVEHRHCEGLPTE